MKKIIFLFIPFILFGCNLYNTPSTLVERYLNNYINLSEEVITDLETKASSEDLSNVNRELYKKVLERQYESLKYEIKDETIDSDKAEVLVNIVVYDLFKAEDESNKYMNENINEFYNSNEEFDNDIYNKYRLNEMLNTTDRIDYDIIFKLKKVDGSWMLETPNRDVLEKIHGLFNYKDYD